MNHPRRRALLRLLLGTTVALSFILIQQRAMQRGQVATALAKGSAMLRNGSQPQLLVNPERLPQVSVPNAQFVSAVRLGVSETTQWDCGAGACILATYYDFDAAGSRSQIIREADMTLLHEWTEPWARPAGSEAILPLALTIAARDTRVTAVLGDIGRVDPVMVPMSGWLSDDDCARDWCVDLTFHAPNGDGRVFHVFVNLDQERVARTFYTRARAEVAYNAPPLQRDLFQNGCHEQYDWQLCWEMTAHDGINFYDAVYDGSLVFDSAKIPQVEAWYPSWPGGYRDEIGFNASVRPYGDTIITDLGDSFEVRQLYTEFARWPNCICCYRYEQVVRLYGDGSYEFRFVSHGPGCDDLSIYRPFWRIDLAGNNEALIWQENAWQAQTEESEHHPFVEPLSPAGFKMTTRSDARLTQWLMERTDPLGLDEARLFLLQWNENEGEGPLTTGPGDTFQPPRQWIDGESLVAEDIVVWFVPLLKTKQGGPWWCMPDPVPDINQCEAILRAVPATELDELTVQEIADLPAATATSPPAPTTTPAPTATPRPIVGRTAEEVTLNAGCGACHQIGLLGEGGKVGPDLSNIGVVAGGRVDDMDARAYLLQSIVDPNRFLAPECPNGPCLANIMPQDYVSRLSTTQIETLVSHLLEQIEPTPEPLQIIGADTGPTTSLAKAYPSAKSATTPPSDGSQGLTLQFLLLGMVFLLTVLLIRQRPATEAET